MPKKVEKKTKPNASDSESSSESDADTNADTTADTVDEAINDAIGAEDDSDSSSDSDENDEIAPDLIIDDEEVEPPKEQSNIIIKTVLLGAQRRTSDRMTVAEFASVMSLRAKHIGLGAPIYVKAGTMTDAKDIALAEIMQKKCPVSFRRPVGPNEEEEWSPNEMILPNVTDY